MSENRLISALSDDEHERFRNELQEFIEAEVKPIAAKIDRSEEFPVDLFKKIGARGWLGIPIPKEFGGAGMDNLSYIIAVEEFSRACGSTGITIAAHTSLVEAPIYAKGTKEQREKYLIPLARGEHLGAFGLTEPNAGSDAGGTETMVRLDGDQYVVNGSKRFITNANFAETIIFTASHDRSKGTRGISAFIVEKDTPGFSRGAPLHKLGLKGSDTGELFFEDCRIPKENILGKEYEGFKVFMETLDGGRISIGALALGEAQGALDSCIKFLREHTLQKSQWHQHVIADMATEISAARHLVYHAARLKDQGFTVTTEGAMAKLYASEACMRVTSKAIQLHGTEGATPRFPVERMFREAKLNEIGEGTSEIQRVVIARQIVGR